VEFHPLWIHGTIMEIMPASSEKFQRSKALHDELIQAVAKQARVIR